MTKRYDKHYFERWYRDPAIASPPARASSAKCAWRSPSPNSCSAARSGRSSTSAAARRHGSPSFAGSARRELHRHRLERIRRSSDSVQSAQHPTRHSPRSAISRLPNARRPHRVRRRPAIRRRRRQSSAAFARFAHMLAGVAYIEAFTTADAMEGDRENWHDATRRLHALVPLRRLTQCGPNCFVNLDVLEKLERLRTLRRQVTPSMQYSRHLLLFHEQPPHTAGWSQGHQEWGRRCRVFEDWSSWPLRQRSAASCARYNQGSAAGDVDPADRGADGRASRQQREFVADGAAHDHQRPFAVHRLGERQRQHRILLDPKLFPTGFLYLAAIPRDARGRAIVGPLSGEQGRIRSSS